MKHAGAKEVEVRSSVHLPLDRFQSIDLTFHLSVAPFQRERIADGLFI